MSREPWGSEAIEFFEAHAESICGQDVYGVIAFYDAEVVADYRALTLGHFPGQLRQGRHQMVSFLDLCLFAPTSDVGIAVVEAFLHPGGAITIERWDDPASSEVATVAVLVEVGSDGIELVRYFPAIEGLAGLDDDASVDAVSAPVRVLAERHWPDRSWSDIEMYGFRLDDGELTEVILIVDEDGPACQLSTAWWWAVDGGTVVDERRHTGVEAAACLDQDDRPEGWWTGLSLPVPLDERRTATVSAGGQNIELYNSDADREALVVWAFERLAGLGLDAPEVGKIIFEPSRACGNYSGLTHLGSNGSTLYHCIRDIACAAPSCDRFSTVAKLSMLHELAHPWLQANVGPQGRLAFLDLTGTTSWDDRSVPWDRRGIEWAAEILAWGLLDLPAELLRIGVPTCELRAQAFEVLTDHEPKNGCETTPS